MGIKKLRIAIIADIMERIPPKHYGGIERNVYALVKCLLKRGHEITLFASDDSQVPCRLIPFGHRSRQSARKDLGNLLMIYYKLFKMQKEFDIIHSFGRLLYLLPLLPLAIPKIQSYSCPINKKRVGMANRFAHGTLTFAACSNSCAQGLYGIGRCAAIYHGVDLELYRFNPDGQGKYLAFLGRLHRIKGAHTAIDIAKAAGQQLKISGTIASSGPELRYFKEEIEPRIDGKQIQFIGPVDDRQKNVFLGEAAALLFPIEWEEPFAMVVLESLACGTPVIAFDRSSVREAVAEGINGFVCKTKEEMVKAVNKLPEIDRRQCRRTVEMRFSTEKNAVEYEKLYLELLGQGKTQ